MKRTLLLAVLCVSLLATAVAADTFSALQAGGGRLAATQNTDGAWGWELTGASASNTVGPIAMGLCKAYEATNNAAMLAAVQSSGSFLLSKTVFSPSDGYLAAELDGIFGGTAYTSYVKANFYDKLAAGTYVSKNVTYDTASYVTSIRAYRAGDQANMAAWDLGMGIVGAQACDADTSAWISGTEAEINELDGSKYYDVLGLAGGLCGLAVAGVSFDPTAGQHAAASNLSDLADVLASYQLQTGGFAWNSQYVIENDSNETTQETAYAVLALNAVGGHTSGALLGSSWLTNTQLPNGGWKSWALGAENNEITGEALWAISAVPEPASILALAMGLCSIAGFRKFRK